MAMMRLSEAAEAIGGELLGRDGAFDSVGTDTRTLAPRALFVALRGERHDGHAFVAQAFASGAAAAVVERSWPGAGDRGAAALSALLVVEDTRRALGRLAAAWRGRFALPLVALTGSSGKTTVKEMIAEILRAACATPAAAAGPGGGVLATRGNLNNDIGVPLMLLELTADHRYAVIEMGMNHAGEIRELARIAAPDVALINNAGHAHMEFLGSREAVARAKGELFEELKPQGTAVINADEPYADLWRGLAKGRRQVEFGIEAPAQVYATYELRYLDSEIAIRMPLGEASATIRAPGLHNVRNALAAAATAAALDVPPAAVSKGLSRFAGIRGRMQKVPGRAGATLIDDTYNANPESVRAAIEVLARAPGRRILVLGDMGELGPSAPHLHAEIGEAARAAGLDGLYALGELSASAVRAFGDGACHFPDLSPLLDRLESALGPGLTILVKGSRFMRMERIVEALAVHDGEAGNEGREAENP